MTPRTMQWMLMCGGGGIGGVAVAISARVPLGTTAAMMMTFDIHTVRVLGHEGT